MVTHTWECLSIFLIRNGHRWPDGSAVTSIFSTSEARFSSGGATKMRWLPELSKNESKKSVSKSNWAEKSVLWYSRGLTGSRRIPFVGSRTAGVGWKICARIGSPFEPVLGVVVMIFFRTEMASFGTVRFAVHLSCFDDHRPVWQAGDLTIVRNPVPPIAIGRVVERDRKDR